MQSTTRYTVQFATNDRADFSLWLSLASDLFDCFTWSEVNGAWQGTLEKSYRLEIISPLDILWAIEYLGRFIKKTYSQESVLISSEKINVAFL